MRFGISSLSVRALWVLLGLPISTPALAGLYAQLERTPLGQGCLLHTTQKVERFTYLYQGHWQSIDFQTADGVLQNTPLPHYEYRVPNCNPGQVRSAKVLFYRRGILHYLNQTLVDRVTFEQKDIGALTSPLVYSNIQVQVNQGRFEVGLDNPHYASLGCTYKAGDNLYRFLDSRFYEETPAGRLQANPHVRLDPNQNIENRKRQTIQRLLDTIRNQSTQVDIGPFNPQTGTVQIDLPPGQNLHNWSLNTVVNRLIGNQQDATQVLASSVAVNRHTRTLQTLPQPVQKNSGRNQLASIKSSNHLFIHSDFPEDSSSDSDEEGSMETETLKERKPRPKKMEIEVSKEDFASTLNLQTLHKDLRTLSPNEARSQFAKLNDKKAEQTEAAIEAQIEILIYLTNSRTRDPIPFRHKQDNVHYVKTDDCCKALKILFNSYVDNGSYEKWSTNLKVRTHSALYSVFSAPTSPCFSDKSAAKAVDSLKELLASQSEDLAAPLKLQVLRLLNNARRLYPDKIIPSEIIHEIETTLIESEHELTPSQMASGLSTLVSASAGTAKHDSYLDQLTETLEIHFPSIPPEKLVADLATALTYLRDPEQTQKLSILLGKVFRKTARNLSPMKKLNALTALLQVPQSAKNFSKYLEELKNLALNELKRNKHEQIPAHNMLPAWEILLSNLPDSDPAKETIAKTLRQNLSEDPQIDPTRLASAYTALIDTKPTSRSPFSDPVMQQDITDLTRILDTYGSQIRIDKRANALARLTQTFGQEDKNPFATRLRDLVHSDTEPLSPTRAVSALVTLLNFSDRSQIEADLALLEKTLKDHQKEISLDQLANGHLTLIFNSNKNAKWKAHLDELAALVEQRELMKTKRLMRVLDVLARDHENADYFTGILEETLASRKDIPPEFEIMALTRLSYNFKGTEKGQDYTDQLRMRLETLEDRIDTNTLISGYVAAIRGTKADLEKRSALKQKLTEILNRPMQPKSFGKKVDALSAMIEYQPRGSEEQRELIQSLSTALQTSGKWIRPSKKIQELHKVAQYSRGMPDRHLYADHLTRGLKEHSREIDLETKITGWETAARIYHSEGKDETAILKEIEPILIEEGTDGLPIKLKLDVLLRVIRAHTGGKNKKTLVDLLRKALAEANAETEAEAKVRNHVDSSLLAAGHGVVLQNFQCYSNNELETVQIESLLELGKLFEQDANLINNQGRRYLNASRLYSRFDQEIAAMETKVSETLGSSGNPRNNRDPHRENQNRKPSDRRQESSRNHRSDHRRDTRSTREYHRDQDRSRDRRDQSQGRKDKRNGKKTDGDERGNSSKSRKDSRK